MSESEGIVTVHIRYGSMEQSFTGSVNDVWVHLNKFFGEMIPVFDLTRKVALTVDLPQLIEDAKGVIAIAPEGPELLVPKDKLTDSETLRLYLFAALLAQRLGKWPADTMTKEDLQVKLGKSMKITTTRLGELVKDGSVVKAEDGSFRISTIGVKRLQGELAAIKMEIW